MVSPSWTTPPSATLISVIFPATVASTGISIFIDSRMQIVSPSATVSPTAETIFQTFATISARTSSLMDSPLVGAAIGGCRQRQQLTSFLRRRHTAAGQLHKPSRSLDQISVRRSHVSAGEIEVVLQPDTHIASETRGRGDELPLFPAD